MKEVEEAAEKELIREFKEGRTEVFDVLVRQYTPVLYRFACGLLENRDDAERAVSGDILLIKGRSRVAVNNTPT